MSAYGMDPSTLPPELLADIAIAVEYMVADGLATDHNVARLRKLITPSPPPPPPVAGRAAGLLGADSRATPTRTVSLTGQARTAKKDAGAAKRSTPNAVNPGAQSRGDS